MEKVKPGLEWVLKPSKPHGVKIKHGRLKLGEFNRRDADSPDIAELVVSAVLLHRGDFWGHPLKQKASFSEGTSHTGDSKPLT